LNSNLSAGKWRDGQLIIIQETKSCSFTAAFLANQSKFVFIAVFGQVKT